VYSSPIQLGVVKESIDPIDVFDEILEARAVRTRSRIEIAIDTLAFIRITGHFVF